jgi:O-antigen/teichoic acid export membrane protein
LQVYVGILANVATGHLAVLSIAFFVDTTSLGFYTLALTLATPLSMVPNTIGTTLFKRFASSATIPPLVSWFTFGITIAALGIFLVSVKMVLLFLYSGDYLPAASLAYLIAIGCTFHGLGDFYNRFLGAHGKGKELRNSALLQGAWNLVGFTALVHLGGVAGAAVARAISGAIYFSALFFYYQRVTGEQKDANP